MDLNIKSEDLFQLADKDIKDGYIERAHKLLEDILRENPSFGKAHNHLGWLHELKYQRLAEAEEYYKKALELSPTYVSTYYNYSILLSNQQRYEELQALLDRALKVPSINRSTIYNEYAIMFESTGEYDQSIHYYKEAAKLIMDNKRLDAMIAAIDRVKKKKDMFGRF